MYNTCNYIAVFKENNSNRTKGLYSKTLIQNRISQLYYNPTLPQTPQSYQKQNFNHIYESLLKTKNLVSTFENILHSTSIHVLKYCQLNKK